MSKPIINIPTSPTTLVQLNLEPGAYSGDGPAARLTVVSASSPEALKVAAPCSCHPKPWETHAADCDARKAQQGPPGVVSWRGVPMSEDALVQLANELAGVVVSLPGCAEALRRLKAEDEKDRGAGGGA